MLGLGVHPVRVGEAYREGQGFPGRGDDAAAAAPVHVGPDLRQTLAGETKWTGRGTGKQAGVLVCFCLTASSHSTKASVERSAQMPSRSSLSTRRLGLAPCQSVTM